MSNYLNLKSKCYIISELGLNHDGNFSTLKKMIRESKKSGCDAVKIQSLYYNSTESEKILKIKKVKIKGTKISLENYLKKIIITDKQHYLLSNYCKKLNIDLISTPLSFDHIDILKKIKVKKIKISSQDIIHLKLIEKAAKTGIPIIISTGMATLNEIDDAVKLIKKYNKNKITILHCLSNYPANPENLNLRRILFLKERYKDCIIGFSDHTKDLNTAIIARTLGADTFEKHFTHNKEAEGFDHSMSVDFKEMKEYCKNIRITKNILGHYGYDKLFDKNSKISMRRSIVAKNNIDPGKKIKLEDIDFKRPGNGIPANKFKVAIGKKTNKLIKKDEQIKISHFRK